MRLLTVSALTFGIASSLGACALDDGNPVEVQNFPHGLWISHTGVVMEPDESVTFTAQLQEHGPRNGDPGTRLEDAADARWWTEDSDVLRVPSESEGRVEAVAPGTGTVWVELGARRDSATVTVLGAGDEPTHRWKDVSSGSTGTCALDEGGQAYCWGDDVWGGWGTGEERRQWTNSYRPMRVNSTLAFAEIGRGSNFACARTAAGEVWCWGLHAGDRLGHGQIEVDFETGPVRVDFPGPATTLSVGFQHACLLDEAREAHCWGSNLGWQLGIAGNAASSREFGGRTVPVEFDGTFEDIYAGAFQSCGLTPDGDLYCWGTTGGGSPDMGMVNPLPSRVAAPVRPYRVNAMDEAGNFLSDEGEIYRWGFSRLGPTGAYQSPVIAETDVRFQELAGPCGLDLNGEAWCWGSEASSMFDPDETVEPCGRPSSDDCTPFPVRVPGGHQFESLNAVAAACGITPAGELYCWGDNEYGQLGIGRPNVEETHIPQRVLDPL